MEDSQKLFEEIKELRKKIGNCGYSTFARPTYYRDKDADKYEKEIKDRILKDLSSWVVGPERFFTRADGQLTFPSPGINNGIYFFGNYDKEIMNAFIEEIKNNPQDWKIEVEKDGILDNLNWGECWVVKHKSGRKHYMMPKGFRFGGFTEKEWAEIERIINNSLPVNEQNNIPHQQNIPPIKQQQNEDKNQEEKEKTPSDKNHSLPFSQIVFYMIIGLLIMVIIVVFLKLKNKNR